MGVVQIERCENPASFDEPVEPLKDLVFPPQKTPAEILQEMVDEIVRKRQLAQACFILRNGAEEMLNVGHIAALAELVVKSKNRKMIADVFNAPELRAHAELLDAILKQHASPVNDQ